jgi:hypothetical protein
MLKAQQSYAHMATGDAHAVIGLSDRVVNVAPPSSLGGADMVTNPVSHC